MNIKIQILLVYKRPETHRYRGKQEENPDAFSY